MEYSIVFSDVDGTLLNSRRELSAKTLFSIRSLRERGIPFVIISGRSPSGIYPIQERYGFRSPVVSFSGALILDENRKVLYSRGILPEVAEEVISFVEKNRFDCTWNIYSGEEWIVKSKRDPRIIREESIVHAVAREGNVHTLPRGADIGKILCMCNPDCLPDIETGLKAAFPELYIVRSSDILLEVMPGGVTKSSAVKELCGMWNIPLEKAVAFGDNYNDIEMLETVGMPFLMGNAPKELKDRLANMTDSNDDDGIYNALVRTGLIPQSDENG